MNEQTKLKSEEEEKMKTMVKGLVLSAAVSSSVMAGAYKIPEQSINSMALGAAYVAHTSGADTAYYNPANMAFMEDKQYIEGGLTLAHLPYNEYTLIAPVSGKSKEENIVIPNFHYVSNAIGNFRWGVSLTAPGGLTKRWDTPVQKAYAQEFTLKVLELSPSFSYKVADNFSIGGGVRLIYSEGVVRSDASALYAMGLSPAPFARDMDGDTFEFGYNLACSYRPVEDIVLAATYRSKVDLDEDGTAILSGIGPTYRGDADVSVPLPAALNLSISKTWDKTFTLEFNYERTYWSAYETLDFNYGSSVGFYAPVFDRPIEKNWKDTDTFRIGATMILNQVTLMMGFALDETPVPVDHVGFELPDSDAKVFTMGLRYQQTENLSWGIAFLYDDKESFSLRPGEHADNGSILYKGGSFSEGGAYLTTIGLAYEF
jgi:long-chain fatty acid transport protein